MIPKEGLDLTYIREALQRRFWLVAVPFFLVFLIIILYCIFAPRVFRAETVILVEPQKVPGEFVSSTVTIDLNSRLRTITQQIKSRTRLEKIINDYDLYPQVRASATMTDAVSIFGQNIEVNVRGGRHAFHVAFEGRDPVKVRDVTNTIANLFIEDNLKLREAQAAGTTIFLDRELQRLQDILEQKETSIREFKEEYRGFLPEDMNQNYTMMAHLQRQLGSLNTTVQQTKDRKILLTTQLNNLRRMEAEFGTFEAGGGDILDSGSDETAPVERWESSDVLQLRAELRKLKARYSEKHPDVMKVQAMIDKLVAEEPLPREDFGEEFGSETYEAVDDSSLFAAQIEDMKAQVLMTNRELAKLLGQQQKTERELAMYQSRIESSPKIEQMLGDLRRGYDQVEGNYSSMLDKKFKAKLSENLEIAQQGEQFTILDHAKLPDKPYKPKARKVLLLGFFAALAGGLGLALLAEYLDRSFFMSKDVERTLQLPVLVSVPVILTDKDREKIILRRAVSAGALVSMMSVLLVALYLLWRLDPMVIAFSAS